MLLPALLLPPAVTALRLLLLCVSMNGWEGQLGFIHRVELSATGVWLGLG